MVENKGLMGLFIPESSALAKMSPRNRQLAPFVEIQWIEPFDPRFEDLVYDTYGTFYSATGNDVVRRVGLEQVIADLSSPVSNAFDDIEGLPMEFRDQHEISAQVAQMLARPLYAEKDPRKSEIWIIHGDEGRSQAVSLTSTLVHTHFENPYPSADLRGLLSVELKGVHLPLPVYVWDEIGFDGLSLFVDNFDERVFKVNAPRGGSPTFNRYFDPIDDTKHEREVLESFRIFNEENGWHMSNPTHQPNGGTSFPDWRFTVDGNVYDIEITRLLNDLFENRMLRYGRVKFDPAETDEVAETLENSKFSEAELSASISKAVSGKSAKKLKFGGIFDCILIISNEIFPVMEPWFRIWEGHDYSEFMVVFLANLDYETDKFIFRRLHPTRDPKPSSPPT